MAKEWGQLKKIPGHKGFSVNEKTGLIYYRATIKGRRIKISTGEKQITKAKKFVDDYLLALTSDNIEQAKRTKRGVLNPLLSDIWTEAVNERLPSRSDTTAVRYGTVWRNDLEPFLRDKTVSDVSPAFVVAFENWFLRTHSGRVFFSARKYMTMLLNYMHREGYASKKLKVADLDKMNKGKKEKHFRVYSDEEQAALIKSAFNVRTRVALMAYFDTGMRKMELLSRKWADVDFDKRTIKVWSQKNKQWRRVPLTERLWIALKDYRTQSPSDLFIFPMASGNAAMSSQVFDRDWLKTKKAAGVRGRARVHDIRHTFATKTSRDSWPIAIACAILDMSADVYMNTYVHVTIDDMAAHLQRSFG